ncbi:hypothetical protein [Bacillus sp. 95MFCvi2.1]|uniref:hypothetical protein n=1 Tax=Bacillus sp. 95MFCvi2.1 TaxID=1151121 RepID=UPI00036F8433|nr:hypothetical protein [Bacillus sp. 95MFCvi2.1]
MIWKIEDKKDFLWYTSDKCQLKIKVNEDKVNIWLNYNGYNIIMPMGMWDLMMKFLKENLSIV